MLHPLVSEVNRNIYNENLSESKVVFQLLAKNNEYSLKAVFTIDAVELENHSKNLEADLIKTTNGSWKISKSFGNLTEQQ